MNMNSNYQAWVKVKPTKGRCSPERAGLAAAGGGASEALTPASSTSKCEVSVGEDTSGM